MIGKARCSATKPDGTRCKGKALPGSTLCPFHARTPEERAELSKRAAARSVEVRKAKAKTRPGSGLAPSVTRDEVMRAVREALNADDRKERLLACLVLVGTFPTDVKQTPAQVRAALEAAIPERVREDPETIRYALAQEMYTLARQEWIALRRRYSPLVGLYVEEFPPNLIAPWEDRETVLCEERPEPIPPEEADKLLTRSVDGQRILERDGELPQLIPSDAVAEKTTMRHKLRARAGLVG